MTAVAAQWMRRGRPWLNDLAAAAATLLGVLGSMTTAVALQHLPGWSLQVPVLAVVLALTAARVTTAGRRGWLEALVELPCLSFAAAAAGSLLIHVPWAGQILLVLGLTVGIFARRYGPAGRRVGRLVAPPFLALLITPVPVVAPAGSAALLWAPVAALIALLWATGCAAAARLLHLVPSPAAEVTPPALAAATVETEKAEHQPAGPGRRRRLDAPTRMAIQMAGGLVAALVAGHALFGDRWPWTVLSAYLVASGNRGRGDVVHKAGLRVVGALVGTVLASSVSFSVPQGHNWNLVLLFAVMLAALALRPRSYAFWAAGVTAMVSLLHGYLGEHAGATAQLLGERLLGVLVGSVIAVSAAWFLVPVRTSDVLRRRIADCLAALTDELADGADPEAPRFRQALERVDELAATLRAHARLPLVPKGPRPLRAVTALHELEQLPVRSEERRALRTATVRVRRAMVGRDDPQPGDLPPALAAVHGVLKALSPR